MNLVTALPLTLLLPLIGAILVAVTGRWPNLRETVTLIVAVALFALVWTLWGATAEGSEQITLIEPVPGTAIAFYLEPLGVLFALVASFLWIITTIYAIGYMRGHGEGHQTRFYAAFAVAIAATMGVAFAANLFTLFIFYEILTISTYPLVTHAGTPEAKRGGRTYLGILIATSIALQLLAIIGTWFYAGTLDFRPGGILQGQVTQWTAAALLVLYVFGIGKAAVMPFHRWLPAAMVAPTPVSALLHAVAVVKAGVFTMLKVSAYIFGSGFLMEIEARQWLLYAAVATILIGSVIALRQDNLKRRLAYSTISQLGYIVLGALLANSLGLLGGALHIATHAFGKITLFFAAGAILVAAHKTEVSEMRGLGRRMPVTFFCFLIGSLSIIGLPPLGGMWSKWYLLMGSLEAGQWLALAALMISSLLNIAYLLPVAVNGFFAGGEQSKVEEIREAPWPCLVAMMVTSLGCVVLFFAPDPLFQLISAVGE